MTFVQLLTVAVVFASSARGGPIHTNVAFTPRKGGSIFRLQYSYTELDVPDVLRDTRVSGVTGTYVYGLRQDVALFVTVPFAHRKMLRVDANRRTIEEKHDGVGDVTLLAKYRFWQNDTRPRETFRLAAIGGLNIRSGDSDFTSNSYDPIVGTVFTWRRDRNLLAADIIYRFNTGGGKARHDALRYDLAYSYQFAPAVYDAEHNYEWNAVAELNGVYTTDGSHKLSLSPGIQYITERWAVEASVQLPVVQDLDDNGPETDYRVVVGVRFQW